MNLWHLGIGLLIFAVLGLVIFCMARGLAKSNADLDEQQQRPRTYGPTSQSPNIRPYSPRVDSPAPRKPVTNHPSTSSSADTTPVVSSYPYSPAIFGTDTPSDSSRRGSDSDDGSSTYRETPTSHYSDSDRGYSGNSSSDYSSSSSDSGSSSSSSSSSDGGGGGGGGGGE